MHSNISRNDASDETKNCVADPLVHDINPPSPLPACRGYKYTPPEALPLCRGYSFRGPVAVPLCRGYSYKEPVQLPLCRGYSFNGGEMDRSSTGANGGLADKDVNSQDIEYPVEVYVGEKRAVTRVSSSQSAESAGSAHNAALGSYDSATFEYREETLVEEELDVENSGTLGEENRPDCVSTSLEEEHRPEYFSTSLEEELHPEYVSTSLDEEEVLFTGISQTTNFPKDESPADLAGTGSRSPSPDEVVDLDDL